MRLAESGWRRTTEANGTTAEVGHQPIRRRGIVTDPGTPRRFTRRIPRQTGTATTASAYNWKQGDLTQGKAMARMDLTLNGTNTRRRDARGSGGQPRGRQDRRGRGAGGEPPLLDLHLDLMGDLTGPRMILEILIQALPHH